MFPDGTVNLRTFNRALVARVLGEEVAAKVFRRQAETVTYPVTQAVTQPVTWTAPQTAETLKKSEKESTERLLPRLLPRVLRGENVEEAVPLQSIPELRKDEGKTSERFRKANGKKVERLLSL